MVTIKWNDSQSWDIEIDGKFVGELEEVGGGRENYTVRLMDLFTPIGVQVTQLQQVKEFLDSHKLDDSGINWVSKTTPAFDIESVKAAIKELLVRPQPRDTTKGYADECDTWRTKLGAVAEALGIVW